MGAVVGGSQRTVIARVELRTDDLISSRRSSERYKQTASLLV